MSKTPARPPSVPAATRPRGRPPKPGRRLAQAEVQRAYRARLAAAGKVVRVVDATPASPAPAAVPDFDPASQIICDREVFEGTRERLHNALLKLELREHDVARLEQRNAYLEGELKLQGQHHTNALKELTLLKQQAVKPPIPAAPGRHRVHRK